MKTSLKNQYVYANQALITIVAIVLGYNIYQFIQHPEKSNIGISLILVVFTSIMVRKYGYSLPKKDKN